MKMFGLKTFLAAGAMALLGSQVGATTVDDYAHQLRCPGNTDTFITNGDGTGDAVRHLDIGWSADNVTFECLAWGYGEPAGENNVFYPAYDDVFTRIGKIEPNTYELADYISKAAGALAESSIQDNMIGLTQGKFRITNQNDPYGYTNFALLWKFGGHNTPAEWIAVKLIFEGIFNFELFWDDYWETCGKPNGQCGNGLSHFSLYGGDPTTTVPLPAGGVLLLTALGGIALMRRRKLVAA